MVWLGKRRADCAPPLIADVRFRQNGVWNHPFGHSELAKEHALPGPDPFTDELTFRWDAATDSLLVLHPDTERWPQPLAQVSSDTLDDMSWAAASRFIGEFVTLLVPELRRRYESQFRDARPGDT